MPNICHRLANCSNVQGSYSCHCIAGFSGDGNLSCYGKTSFKFRKGEAMGTRKIMKLNKCSEKIGCIFPSLKNPTLYCLVAM